MLLGEHPVVDRLQALFSANHTFAADGGIARLFQQLIGAAPAPASQAPAATPAIAAQAPAPAPIEPVVSTPSAPPAPQPVPTPWIDIDHEVPVVLAPIEEPVAADSAAEPTPEAFPLDPEGRSAVVLFGSSFPWPIGGIGAAPFGPFAPASHFTILYTETFDPGPLFDRGSMVLLPGGAGDFPELGQAIDDTLVLSGDFSSGWSLPTGLAGIDTLVVLPGFDYNFIAADDDVAAGATLVVNGAPLLDANSILFDGSAETDGRFMFLGSETADIFLGGAGNDRIMGNGGGDLLSGGGGRDEFVYANAAESTGANYDTIGDFNPAEDRIDLSGRVSGFAAAVTAGTLSQASFDADLAAAAGGLGASQAMWFAPDAGDLAGKIFLVVDTNGVAGYQEGEDLVIAIDGSPLADLTGHTDIFI